MRIRVLSVLAWVFGIRIKIGEISYGKVTDLADYVTGTEPLSSQRQS
jgi:hypothetical protein